MTMPCEVCGTRTNVCRSMLLGVLCGACVLWAVFEFHAHGRSIA